MGEEGGKGEPEKEKKKDSGGGGGGGEKKEGGGKKESGGGLRPVELKVDLHCDGCALKVRKAVKTLPGVEKVTADPSNHKLKVVGPVDPWKLKELVEAKTQKKAEFISPKDLPKKNPESIDAKKPTAGGAADVDAKKEASKTDEKKPKPPSPATVVLKIRLHCDGCIQRINKTIRKIKGVEDVTFDGAKDLVAVKGTMDVKPLPAYLKDKLKRSVEIVPPKKDGGGEKKEKGGEGGGGEKKEKKDGGGEREQVVAAAAEANKMDYYQGYGYRIEMVHAPLLFSDENPNACFVM